MSTTNNPLPKKPAAPRKLRAKKPAATTTQSSKLRAKASAKTSQAAHELAGRWQEQMKKYQSNLQDLVHDLKTLDKDAAKKLVEQAKTVGEREWHKVLKNVEEPLETFLKDLHNAKQNVIRDSEEMVKNMRARLRLLQKQVKKTLKGNSENGAEA